MQVTLAASIVHLNGEHASKNGVTPTASVTGDTRSSTPEVITIEEMEKCSGSSDDSIPCGQQMRSDARVQNADHLQEKTPPGTKIICPCSTETSSDSDEMSASVKKVRNSFSE